MKMYADLVSAAAISQTSTKRLPIATVLTAWLLVAAILCTPASWGATQGQPGRTSTATVNITLRIYAQPPVTSAEAVTTLRHAPVNGSGFVALQRYCESERGADTAALIHGVVFEARLGHDRAGATTVAQFCDRAAPAPALDGATLLVAPI